MDKPNNIVRKETKYIAINIVLLSAIMQCVFIALKKWDLTVLWGNLLTAVVMILNFYFMGLAVSKAVEKDADEAKKIMRISQNSRTVAIFAAVVVGVALPCFNTVAVIVPVFFTRIAIAIRPLWKDKGKKEVEGDEK